MLALFIPIRDELGLGFSDLPFAIANQRSENGPATAHVRIGWLRSVANIYHAFGIQSFEDELALRGWKRSCRVRASAAGAGPNHSEERAAEGLHELRP